MRVTLYLRTGKWFAGAGFASLGARTFEFINLIADEGKLMIYIAAMTDYDYGNRVSAGESICYAVVADA